MRASSLIDPRLRGWGVLLLALPLLVAAADGRADVAVLGSTADNTLIETLDGSLSSGASEFFFAGRVNFAKGPSIRRGVLRFDVAASLPPTAVVQTATLRLGLGVAARPSASFALHRLEADWGEGSSSGAPVGNPATPGDATWLHSFFATTLWGTVGGDFVSSPSATKLVAAMDGEAEWTSTQMAADVQAWLADPASDFGWIVVGDESIPRTAFGFGARENLVVSQRPQLTIEFAPEPGGRLALLTALAALLVGRAIVPRART